LAQQRFTSRSVLHRVPILVSFGEFAKARHYGADTPISRINGLVVSGTPEM
jgi:hypothetical protein